MSEKDVPVNAEPIARAGARARVVLGAVVVAASVLVASAAGLGAARASAARASAARASAAAPGVVVGFGDSVAAGYGLSAAASWPGSYLNRRFPPPAGARCATTPAAYPCVLAGLLGDNVAASRDYAIQGAESGGVATLQLPRARRDLSASARAAVSTVTLTVGANDIDFTRCLADELTAISDPCVAGPSGHLRVSGATIHGFSVGSSHYDGLSGLTANISKLLPALEATYPNAKIAVTDYYPFFASVPVGATACKLFALPALSQLLATLKKDSLPVALLDAERGLRQLKSDEVTWQNRAFAVQQVLEQALHAALATAIGADARVALVALPSFAAHGVCAGAKAWVFGPSVSVELAAKNLPSVVPALHVRFGTSACPFPDSSSEGVVAVFPPTNANAAFRAIASLVGLHGSLTYATNCLPHPTIDGQRYLAQAIAAQH